MEHTEKLLDTLLKNAIVEQSTVRAKFTVTLNEPMNRRLQYIARMLGTNRADLSAKALYAFILDSEKKFGLDFNDETSTYFNQIISNESIENLVSNPLDLSLEMSENPEKYFARIYAEDDSKNGEDKE